MQQNYYLGLNPMGFHRLGYTEWNEKGYDRVIICVHGLTRNGRDFDYLARTIQQDFRVICPDIVGRGKSDWLAKPSLYGFPQYLSDLNALIARLNVEEIDWIGTSMGGLLGMIMASLPKSPIRRLVINDVGPKVPKLALLPIIKYAKSRQEFETLKELETHLRTIYAPFGKLTDEQWAHVAVHSHIIGTDGKYSLACDPGVTGGWRALFRRSNFWEYWKKISCPILVLRGEQSTILTPTMVIKMQEYQPLMTLVEIPDVGHAPALMDAQQTKLVYDWLRKGVKI